MKTEYIHLPWFSEFISTIQNSCEPTGWAVNDNTDVEPNRLAGRQSELPLL